MIDGKTVLVLITARGGSKGIPGKNLRRIAGHSLVGWAALAALGSRHVDRVVLSTDSAEIAEEGRRYGCDVPFLRPAELATDTATSRAVALHVLDSLEAVYDYLVLVQPTSPLRTAEDIDGCLALCHGAGAESAASVSEVDKTPYWMYTRAGDGRLQPVVDAAKRPTRRQDAPPCYVLNGAVYVVTPDWLRRSDDFVGDGTLGFLMPRERMLDIDTVEDLAAAEARLVALSSLPGGRT